MASSMKLVLLGPPGSGKSTVAEKISEEFSLYDLYMGDLLRAEIAKDTIVGKEIAKYTAKGKLVPGNFVSDLVYLLLLKKRKFLLDGFPRTVQQADYIKQMGIKINAVLYLEVPKKEVIKRLSQRRLCPNCRAQYHLIFFSPKKKGICDNCKSKLIRRKDDNPKIIEKRFKEYHKETAPLIEYFKKDGILYTINGDQSPTKVLAETRRTLKKIFKK